VLASVVHLDFETRSACDLRKAGAYVYSKHPTTEVLCVGLARETREPQVEHPANIRWPWPHQFIAHNAAFELAIWNNVCVPRYGWPPLTPDRITCTMVMAYSMGLPGGLDDASAAVGIEVGKDMAGKRVMMQLCRPKTEDPLTWYEPDKYVDKFEQLYAYCAQDVKVERELFHRLRQLSPYERGVWELDQKINQRGIGIDVQAVTIARELVEMEKSRLNNLMEQLTGGFVPTCTANTALLRWIRGKGIKAKGVAKADISEILRSNPPRDIRMALQLRREAAKTSTAKLKAMLESAGEDGRIRGTLQYHGASTGRWAGRKLQVQNFPRPKLAQDDIEWVINLLKGDQ